MLPLRNVVATMLIFRANGVALETCEWPIEWLAIVAAPMCLPELKMNEDVRKKTTVCIQQMDATMLDVLPNLAAGKRNRASGAFTKAQFAIERAANDLLAAREKQATERPRMSKNTQWSKRREGVSQNRNFCSFYNARNCKDGDHLSGCWAGRHACWKCKEAHDQPRGKKCTKTQTEK